MPQQRVGTEVSSSILQPVRNRYLLLADIIAIGIGAWSAFALRFTWLFLDHWRYEFLYFTTLAVVCKIVVFYAFGMYRRFWRYAGFWDLMAMVLANLAASTLLFVVVMIFMFKEWGPGISRSVPPVDMLLTLALTVGTRASIRALSDVRAQPFRAPDRDVQQIVIVGAGDAGAMVAREMQKNPQLGLQPIGFLDDDAEKMNKQIYGLPVLGPVGALKNLARSRRIDEVVIALPRAGGRVMRDVAEQCHDLGIPSRAMPGVYELLDGRLTVSRLRQVDIGDLLRRPQLDVSGSAPEYLRGARIMVTGAGGSIGSELCRQIASAHPAHLFLVGHGENSVFSIAGELQKAFPRVLMTATIVDVRDRERLFQVFAETRPQIVFHAAAHKHVPLMEGNAPEAVTNNIGGTGNVVDAAVSVGVERLVMVSTDKAASPSNMMGASKRVAETIVRRAALKAGKAFVVVRFGNVLGSRGSVVPIFQAQIEAGGPVTVTHPEVRRYFMTIPEAVHLILQAGSIGSGGELFVLDMGSPVLLKDLAEDMIRLSGFESEEIPVIFTGLRPGEKLNEILWEEGASVEPSDCADVWRVSEPWTIEDDRLTEMVGKLGAAASANDPDGIARVFREYIPSATVRQDA